MSDTYRKGFVKDRCRSSRSQTLIKRRANRKARKLDLPNGSAYKKAFETWDICDYHGYDNEYPNKIKKKNRWGL